MLSAPRCNTDFVKDGEGIIMYNVDTKRYGIRRTIPGIIDAVDVGYRCTQPDSLMHEGRKVIFCGFYYNYGEGSFGSVGGITKYYMRTSKIDWK